MLPSMSESTIKHEKVGVRRGGGSVPKATKKNFAMGEAGTLN